MTGVALTAMTPAQEQGWNVLLDLSLRFPSGWCLVGGQMVWLLAAEHGAKPLRATDDVDLVVDIRSEPGGIRRLCQWLEGQGFGLEGINPEGIGHRYVRTADPGPGKIIFDVLAPDKVGSRADLSTTQGARTLEAPGTRKAIDSSQSVEVTLNNRNGIVLRPTLVAAIILKATTTTIPTRPDTDRDFTDSAFLLTLISDPIAVSETLTKSGRADLQPIKGLLNADHPAWRPLGDRARLGQTALDFMIDPDNRLR